MAASLERSNAYMTSPIDGPPRIERRAQYLYDSDVFSSVTRQMHFFKVPMGKTTVAGAAGTAVNKTFRHTNMFTAGKLPAPKFFMVRGVRVWLQERPQTADDEVFLSTFGAGGIQQLLEGFLRYRTYFEFRIGGHKPYIQAPTYMVPGNVGIDGLASATVGLRVDGGAAATTTMASTVHAAGKYFGFGRNPRIIQPEQSFGARLKMTPATLADIFAFLTTNHRFIYCFLDGILGDEVM